MFAGAIKTTASTSSPSFRHRAGNCVLITIAVICVCILVACGVMIVREYALGKSYVPSVCFVSNITYTKNRYIKCTYCSMKQKTKEKGKGTCEESFFPCVQILVNYTLNGKKLQGTLHPDSLQARGQFKQCSFNVCLKSRDDNDVKVAEFAQQWRNKGRTKFDCFYNTEDHSSVIEYKNHTKSQVIHSMFWPSLVIIICGVIFLRLEMTRRGLTFCGVQGPHANTFHQRPAAHTSRRDRPDDAKNGLLSTHGRAGFHRSLEHVSDNRKEVPEVNDYQSVNSKSLSNLDRMKLTQTPDSCVKKNPNSVSLPLKAIVTKSGITHQIVNKSLDSNALLKNIPDISIDTTYASESPHTDTEKEFTRA